jgi:mono/diheme cytochrome c family protein
MTRTAITTAAVALATAAALAQSSVKDGVYTTTQADAGAALYETRCFSCHGALDAFLPEVAALLGDHTFRQRWEGRPLAELFELVQVEMPQDAPGSLSLDETAQLVAFILQGNKLPAGDAPLATDPAALSEIMLALE